MKIQQGHIDTFIQLVKYSAVAGIGLAFDFGSLIILKQVVRLNYLVAVCGGFIIGLIVTYFLSNWLVFGQPKDTAAKAFTLFALIGVVGLGILSLLEWLLTGRLGLNYLVSKVLATAVVFIWNFFARRKLYTSGEAKPPYEL
jgi:putative flippase GtrA